MYILVFINVLNMIPHSAWNVLSSWVCEYSSARPAVWILMFREENNKWQMMLYFTAVMSCSLFFGRRQAYRLILKMKQDRRNNTLPCYFFRLWAVGLSTIAYSSGVIDAVVAFNWICILFAFFEQVIFAFSLCLHMWFSWLEQFLCMGPTLTSPDVWCNLPKFTLYEDY